MKEHFDPIGAIGDADTALAEFREYVFERAEEHPADDLSRLMAHRDRLSHANDLLGLQIAFFKRMTPSRGRFAFEIAVGLGSIAAAPWTFGWSLFVTVGSVGITLNSARDYVDNHAQMERIGRRLTQIEDALMQISEELD